MAFWNRMDETYYAPSSVGVLKVKHEKPHEGKTPEAKDLLPHASALWDFDHFGTSGTSGLWEALPLRSTAPC
jgi:hypothetical protein